MVELALKIILILAIIYAVVYTYSLFYAQDDELEDDAMDCFVTAFIFIIIYGLVYMIYWAMRSIVPYTATPVLYMGVYYMCLALCYYIRCLAAIQKEYKDNKIHFRHNPNKNPD